MEQVIVFLSASKYEIEEHVCVYFQKLDSNNRCHMVFTLCIDQYFLQGALVDH